MTTNTDVHTCSYYCERPGCIRAQRDELRDRLEREESDHGRAIDQRDAAEDALGRMFQAVTGRPAEWSSAWGYVDAIEEVEEHVAALAQQPAAPSGEAVGEWVLVPREPTDAMLRAAQSAWLNDTLRRTTAMWRAMLEAAPRRPAGADEAEETDLWRCTVCGLVGTVGRCCGEETREPFAPPSAPAGVDWPTIVEGLREADHFFDGDDRYSPHARKVRAAYRAALAAQQQEARNG